MSQANEIMHENSKDLTPQQISEVRSDHLPGSTITSPRRYTPSWTIFERSRIVRRTKRIRRIPAVGVVRLTYLSDCRLCTSSRSGSRAEPRNIAGVRRVEENIIPALGGASPVSRGRLFMADYSAGDWIQD